MRYRIVKAAGVAGAATSACLLLAGCPSGQNANSIEQGRQAQQQKLYDNNQPIHQYNWSMERQILLDAEDAAARGDQSTSFFFNFGVQDPVMICPSLGLAVPDTAQLSNPEMIAPITSRWGGGATTLPQMDPFGIYTPPVSEGTYVICLIGGKPVLQRAEETVHTVLAPAVWDKGLHQIHITGASSMTITTKPPPGVSVVKGR